MSSLVIQTSFLGDMVLTTPLLERLAERGPVDVVATPANASLLRNHPAVRDVIVFDKRGSASGVRGVLRVASAVRWRLVEGRRIPRGATVAYLAQGSLRSAALAKVAGIRERVGFETSSARWLYTRRVPYRRELHHAARLWHLASRAEDALPLRLKPSLFPGPLEASEVDALFDAEGVDRGTPIIALAPGSVWATKRWPSYDALAAELMKDAALHDFRLVVVGGEGDSALAGAIASALHARGAERPLNACGKLSLLASAELIGRARVLVTNDSAPLHLASAMDTPTVALFGPTVPAFGFGPLARQQRVLGVDTLDCRPCHAHGPQRCPLGHWRCMRELSVQQVGATARSLALDTE